MRNVERILQALDLITRYGGTDGSHHKQWLLDQIVRVLASDYDKWVEAYCYGEDGADTYWWDKGIAP